MNKSSGSEVGGLKKHEICELGDNKYILLFLKRVKGAYKQPLVDGDLCIHKIVIIIEPERQP